MRISEIVNKYTKDLQPKYKQYALKTQELLNSLMVANSIQVHSITAREKDPESLRKKILLKEESYSDPLDQITDLAGARIITYFLSDVDKIVPLIDKEFEIDPINSIDKRKTSDPTSFGYTSVHLIVKFSPKRLRLPEYKQFRNMKCEIQVRTILQHAWAEIEHDIVYKSNEDIPFELRRKFASLGGLLEVADREFETLRLDEIKIRAQIQKTIQSKNIAIPVDLESLRFYLEKYHNEKIDQIKRLSGLNRLIQNQKIATIEELNRILTKEAVNHTFKEAFSLKQACPGVDKCLLKYGLAIGDYFEIPKDQLSRLLSCPMILDPEKFRRKRLEARSRTNK